MSDDGCFLLEPESRAAFVLRGHTQDGTWLDGLLILLTHLPQFTDNNEIVSTDTHLTASILNEAVGHLLEAREGPLGTLGVQMFEGAGYVAQLITDGDRRDYRVTDDVIAGELVIHPVPKGERA